ncbi:TetR/AcrR family transcriptional regulator [Sphingomonas sp. PL-96]|uniref:TetR/AcrR family transcriptional regulator n=1 Tax=Sphingomonas sp. PL-96 TaxID=2887201 RepID=UPI001E4EFA38|nr:TetR/AcrR family transcriptional regulator [Sphingomonas sp. PL-96]MCC2978246.1 TetR/AcrR family transcriptional regulator [Sphingomonas sp. PL-96]
MYEDPRSRLLTCAEEAFLSCGYGATRLSEVASAAGISKKTIYRLVESKAALFAAVVEKVVTATVHPSSLDGPETEDPQATLRAFVRPFAQLALSYRGIRAHRLVLTEAVQFPELAKHNADNVHAAVAAPLAAWMARQVAAGVLNVPNPDIAVGMLIAMIVSEPLQAAALGITDALQPEAIDARVDEGIRLFLLGAQCPAEVQRSPRS